LKACTEEGFSKITSTGRSIRETVCGLYLLSFDGKLILFLMTTEENKQERQGHICPALVSENGRLLTYFFPSKNQDNSLRSACHPQSPIFSNSPFEPIIEG